MRRIETLPISHRTELFTAAKFASVKAMSDTAEPSFPTSESIKLQKPSIDVQRMILFFKSPDPNNSSSFSQFDVDEQRMVEKVAEYPWSSSMPADGSLDTELKKARARGNIAEAINIVKDGFKIYGEKRKTGESTYIHSLRTLVRGNSELKFVGFNRQSTLYTSSIARVLHDAQEDFDDFSIKPTENIDLSDVQSIFKYEVSYDNKRSGRNKYYLQLTHNEAKLLRMQINALSIPSEIDALEDNDGKTKAQIHHLLTKTDEIYKEFGEDAFAAYQTLRIKLDDRIDNILTYYADGKGDDPNKIHSKLRETILYFRDVEQGAKLYFSKYINEIKTASGRKLRFPFADTSESLVHFCYYILNGGTYDEFFAEYLDKAEFGYMKTNDEDFLNTVTADDMLLPSLNPAANPIRVSKRFNFSFDY